jgi:sulfoxide reductase heme-binding subunit YedZ
VARSQAVAARERPDRGAARTGGRARGAPADRGQGYGGGGRRHATVAALTCGTVLLFWLSRPGWHWMHAWNRAFADASLVLLVATLAIGPLARLWSPAARWLAWRRELGVWSIIAALGHVLIVMHGWVEWDPSRLFYTMNPFRRDWALDQGFALGNLLGIVALGYGLVQMVTSNDMSIRLLGGSSWKLIQQSAYLLYVLVALHTAYFLFWQFVSFHRPVPPPNWLQGPFLVAVALLFGLQTAAFVVTVRRRANRSRPGAPDGRIGVDGATAT